MVSIIRKTKRCEIVKRSVRLHKTKCCFFKAPSPYDKTPRNKKNRGVFLYKMFYVVPFLAE